MVGMRSNRVVERDTWPTSRFAVHLDFLAGRRRDGVVFNRGCRRSIRAVPRTYGVVRGRIQGRIAQANEPTSSPPPIHPRRIREPGGSRPSRPADHDRASLAGRRRDGLFFGRCRRSIRAVPRTYGVVRCGIQGRIGQANEPTSPSPPRPADHDRRPAFSEGAAGRVGSSRSLGAVPRTYGVVYGGGRGCGLSWNPLGGPCLRNTGAHRSSHQRTSSHVQAYAPNTSSRTPSPAVTGTYAVL